MELGRSKWLIGGGGGGGEEAERRLCYSCPWDGQRLGDGIPGVT